MHAITIDFNYRQPSLNIHEESLQQAVKNVLRGECITNANIRVAIVDDLTIHKANRQFLGHDEPTDVLSFPWKDETDPANNDPECAGEISTGSCLEGDIMISAETATRQATEYGWSASDELLLYLIHGTLHLLGYDDHDESDRAEMRDRERHYLGSIGLVGPL